MAVEFDENPLRIYRNSAGPERTRDQSRRPREEQRESLCAQGTFRKACALIGSRSKPRRRAALQVAVGNCQFPVFSRRVRRPPG